MEQNQILGLNAPYGAWCFLTDSLHVRHPAIKKRLNAPFGARCFLTLSDTTTRFTLSWTGLNAPFGARCFLTRIAIKHKDMDALGLNAPFGARCFLTANRDRNHHDRGVLMHLLALGAF